MGANVSSQEQEALTTTVQSIITDVNTTVNNTQITSQRGTVKLSIIAGDVTGSTITQLGKLNLDQKVTMNTNISLTNEQTNDLVAKIENTLKAFFKGR